MGSIEVWRADWKLYAETDAGNYYYHAASLIRMKGVIRVWTRLFHSEEGKIQSMKVLGVKLGVSVVLQEINCVTKISRLLKITHYDNKAIVIGSESPKEPQWDYIIPESIAEYLYEAICK